MLCSIIFKTAILFVSCDFANDGANYIAASAQDALNRAQESGMLLPTPEVVEAIREQADCRIVTHPKDPTRKDNIQRHSDEAMRQKVNCKPGDLISGHYKTIVLNGGTVGLYGWYTLSGKRIQPFFSGHSLDYVDYSQGVRLVASDGVDIKTGERVSAAEVMYGITP